MKLNHFAWWGALVVCVLVLLVWTAWLSGQHHFRPMPKSLTTPPNVDRSRIPLGPYTVDLEGLVAGWTSDSVTLYVVIGGEPIHFQRQAEFGVPLADVSVIPLILSLQPEPSVKQHEIVQEIQVVDGLLFVREKKRGDLMFVIPHTTDTYGNAIRVSCNVPPTAVQHILQANSLAAAKNGWCRARFYPRPHIIALISGISVSARASTMAAYLPELLQLTSNRIHGVP